MPIALSLRCLLVHGESVSAYSDCTGQSPVYYGAPIAITKWIRRLAWSAQKDQLTDPELLAYLVGERQEPEEGRMLMVKYSRPAQTPAEDAMITTHHFLNVTAGSTDTTWVDADFLVVENALSTWWTAISPYVSVNVVLDQLRWYKFNAETEQPGVENPPVRVVELNSSGAGSGPMLPPQCAISVTEKTALRKGWGRFYIPGPPSSTLNNSAATYGRINNTTVDAIATATQLWYESCSDGDIMPVVWSPTHKHAYSIEKIQVDDIYDVIRSRRFATPLRRTVKPVTP